MVRWNKSIVLLDNEELVAGTPQTFDISRVRAPVIFVKRLDDAGGNETVTVRLVGDAGTYQIHHEDLNEEESFLAKVPNCEEIELESSATLNYVVEARSNRGGDFEIVEP